MTWKLRLLTYLVPVIVAFISGLFLGHKGPSVAKSLESSHSNVQSTSDQKTAVTKVATKTDHKTIVIHTVSVVQKDCSKTIDKTVTISDNVTLGTNTVTHEQDDTKAHTVSDNLTIKTYQKDWRVSALVGGTLVNPLQHAGNPLGAVAYGVHAERRIGGPIWGGLWVLGAGPKAQYWTTGVSLGFEF